MSLDLTKMCDDLSVRVIAAGHWIAVVDGVPESSDDKAVQAIIDAYTLADYIANRKREVSVFAAQLRDKALTGTSALELASWPVKLAEAKTFGKVLDAPLLTQEAAARGISIDALVAKVQANATELSTLEAQIAGVEGKHRDTIMGLKDFDSVARYDFTGGWPAV